MEHAAIHEKPATDARQQSQSSGGVVGASSTTIDVQEASLASSSDPSLQEPLRSHSHSQSTASEHSDSADSGARRSRSREKKKNLKRPPLGSRKSSGTIIISRECPVVAKDEQYDENDARAMSPRRTEDEIQKMGDDARQALEEYAHLH